MIGTYVSDLFVEEIYIFWLQVNRIEKVKSRNRWRTSMRLRQFEKFFLSFHIPMELIEMVKSLWLNPLEWSWGSYPLPFLSCSLPPSSLPSSLLPLYLLPSFVVLFLFLGGFRTIKSRQTSGTCWLKTRWIEIISHVPRI